MKNNWILFLNNGSATLKVGRYMHTYDDMRELADDVSSVLNGANPVKDNWDNNEYDLHTPQERKFEGLCFDDSGYRKTTELEYFRISSELEQIKELEGSHSIEEFWECFATIRKKRKDIAYIFEDVGGWYINDDETVAEDNCLDCRGDNYESKAQALRQASYHGYTHYRHAGIVKIIPQKYRYTKQTKEQNETRYREVN